jgi:hypothetical protein
MPAKYWLLPLFALALLVFAAHGPARAEQEQFVVTYVEFLPAKHGSLLLIPFGWLATTGGPNGFTPEPLSLQITADRRPGDRHIGPGGPADRPPKRIPG